MTALHLSLYAWFTFAVSLMVRLTDWDTDRKQVLAIMLMILFPLTTISFYSYNIKNTTVRFLNMTTTNLINKLSSLTDKAAIRFINVLDRLRGDYEKDLVHNARPMTRASYHRGK